MSLQSQEILTEAHELSESVISSMHDFDPELLSRLQSDTVVLTRRFEYNRNLEDLTKAISITRRALASPILGTRKWKFQQLLGIQLGYLFQKTEKKDDIEAAITSLQAAVEVERLSPADKAVSLDEYGKVLFARFKLNNKKADLEQAIKVYKEALEIWGSENDSIVSCMNNLGNAMVTMFEMTADPRELPSDNHSSYGRPRRTGTFSSHFS
ncbi:hypothetical protein NLJ89_g8141 [Agrocybe chaxingu]|uniref:Uncharacterized protein n=1 Tax=Agrocybe chaxingu TaxID=84603 RepID=A0A9W8JW05_9AGAR|nr:hypothetical protein NLJ89_g8141 [Agrocybe chaxingu]